MLGADDPQFSPEDFSIPEMLAFWDRTVAKANTEGYEVARLSAEAAWWGPQLPGGQALIAYESELNTLTARQPAAILCLYDLNDCTGGLVIELMKTHPRIMINRLVIKNPWYMRPEEFGLHVRRMAADCSSASTGHRRASVRQDKPERLSLRSRRISRWPSTWRDLRRYRVRPPPRPCIVRARSLILPTLEHPRAYGASCRSALAR